VPLFNPSSAERLVQTAFTEVTSDTTTTSTTFVDLLSITITTGTNNLLIYVSHSFGNTSAFGAQVFVRLVLDGAAVRGAADQASSTFASSGAIASKKAVTAGSHTIKVQWRVGGSTGQCRPVAAPDSEHCALLVIEESV